MVQGHYTLSEDPCDFVSLFPKVRFFVYLVDMVEAVLADSDKPIRACHRMSSYLKQTAQWRTVIHSSKAGT